MRKRVEATIAIFLILSCVGLRLAYTSYLTTPEESVDLITIDTLAPFDTLQRPVVRFSHELHVSATGGDASCIACHEPHPDDTSGLSFTLKDQQGLSREDIQDLYHAECIGCHADRESDGQPTGPQVCSGCHVKHIPETSPISHAVDFDSGLHVVHTDNAALDCQACHGILASGDMEKVTDSGDTGKAAHALCITCHVNTVKAGTSEAPLNCGGCHALPRPALDDAGTPAIIAQGGEVEFDHDLHDEAGISCEVCHHKEPDTGCAECHTSGESPKGGGVTLQVAMHSRTADRSCIGCHNTMEAGVIDDCTGCHTPFSADPQ